MPTPSSTAHSRLSTRAPPRIDHRILIVIIVLGIFAMVLIAVIIFITVRLKKRPPEACGPYEGTLVHPHHLAAQIMPFGAGGPHRGRNEPLFGEF